MRRVRGWRNVGVMLIVALIAQACATAPGPVRCRGRWVPLNVETVPEVPHEAR